MIGRVFRIASSMIGCLLALTVQPARADSITLSLTTGNPALSGYTGPYGSVSVSRADTTHATITFTSLTSGGNIYLFGDGGSVAVNVNATSWTLGAISGANAGTGFTQVVPAGDSQFSDGGAGNEDGFGKFNQTINSFDGFTHSSDTMSFTLTETSGTAWTTAGDVLKLNSNGAAVAAHIFVTTSPADGSNTALVTGYAAGNNTPGGGGTPPTVPDGGATAALLGLGLLGVGAVRTRFSRN